jgi:diadenosine tetraphosphatase ApaH/serine/threonine PP2A family protein phosphatase
LHAKNQGVTDYAFLGDFVDYGANPKAVLDTIINMSSAKQVWAIQGNHDQMALNPSLISEIENIAIRESTLWTNEQLTSNHKKFLAELPLITEYKNILFVHGSAYHPEKWRYVDNELSAEACLEAATKNQNITHVFVGHIHHQTLYYQGSNRRLMNFSPTTGVPVPVPIHRKWVVTVGSVGQPRDGDVRAMYSIFDQNEQRLTFFRVPYDFSASANAIRSAGLPESFASRLEKGR